MNQGLKRMFGLLRSGNWLDGHRMMAWSGILLTFEILVFVFFVAGTHGYIIRLEKPITTDFVSFYAAGSLTNSGHPSLVYSQPDHYEAEQAATAPGIEYVFFFYPPVFLMLCSLLARLPYLLSFLVFETASCLLYLLVIRQILNERGWRWLLPVMAFPAVFWVVGVGQNSFLTAAFFGAATLLLDRRPAMAGLAFGLLCYKPHFGLLIPIALAAGRHWRAFVAANVSVAVLVVLSALLFGLEPWRAFLMTFITSSAVFAEGRVPFAGLVSVFAAARILGLSAGSAYLIQAAVTATVAVTVGAIWYRDSPPSVRFASLIAGTLLAVPVVLFYDLLLLAVAGCWLTQAGRSRGFLTWEITVLAGTFLVPLLSRSWGIGFAIPIGPLAALAVLGLCCIRSGMAGLVKAQKMP